MRAGVSFTLPHTMTLSSPGRFLTRPLAAVPEPATWALLIGGIGRVGETLRRRQERRGSAAAIAVR